MLGSPPPFTRTGYLAACVTGSARWGMSAQCSVAGLVPAPLPGFSSLFFEWSPRQLTVRRTDLPIGKNLAGRSVKGVSNSHSVKTPKVAICRPEFSDSVLCD